MRNPGHPPYTPDGETVSTAPVDIRLENGWVIRGVDPSKYDWRIGDKCAGIPIEQWQKSGDLR
jgi:hypothetical protein